MKYNVGDRVLIKSIDWYNENKNKYGNIICGYMPFTSEMSIYCGEVLTICDIKDEFSYYHIKECEYMFTDEMIEGKVGEETTTHNNMCKQLIDEMNPNVEINVKVKTKPQLKFKVGDRIYSKYHKPSNDLEIIEIVNMKDGNCAYRIKNHKTNGTYLIWGYEMSNYKLVEEETKPAEPETTSEGKKRGVVYFWDNDFADKVELDLSDRELIQEDGKWFVVKKKKEYPKTYEECCRIVNANPYIRLMYDLSDGQKYSYDADNLRLYESIRKLKICRDAYWKIAGEEMGLGKPWEPNFKQGEGIKYTILLANGEVIWNRQECICTTGSRILAFPTKEMRDAFYEVFKELIEECKELL